MKGAYSAVARTCTLGEPATDEEVWQGPIYAEWEVVRLVSFTRKDLSITIDRADISFDLSFETSAASGAMLLLIESL